MLSNNEFFTKKCIKAVNNKTIITSWKHNTRGGQEQLQILEEKKQGS